MDRSTALDQARNMLPKDARLLYLTEFGSRLYGTATDSSDYDYQGLFLPSLWDLSLMKQVKSFQCSSGSADSKNSSEDYDIQLWSLQYWLLTLIMKMDTVALDLFFSSTNPRAVIFQDEVMDMVFASPEMFITSDKVNDSSYIRYAISQAKRYGVKGTKLNILLELDKFLTQFEKNCHGEFLNEERLSFLAGFLLKEYGDDTYLTYQELPDGVQCLQICGKQYPYHIRLSYFIDSIRAALERYGERARKAANNEGIDWKALSHAVRAIHQTIQLCTEGYIVFPFEPEISQKLIDIKLGRKSFDYVSQEIENGIQAVSKIQPEWYGKWTHGYAERIIWSLYRL